MEYLVYREAELADAAAWARPFAAAAMLGLLMWCGTLTAQTYYYTTSSGSVRHHDLSVEQPGFRSGAPTGGIQRKDRLSPGFESKVTRYEKVDRSAARRASQQQPPPSGSVRHHSTYGANEPD